MSDAPLHEQLTRAGRVAWAALGLVGLAVLVAVVADRLSLVLIPLVLALFPATLLAPLASRLRARRLPDSLAALVAMLLALLLVAGIIGAMVPLVAADIPQLAEAASEGIERIERFLEEDPLGLGLAGPSELLEAVRDQLGALGDYVEQAVSAGTAVVRVATGFVLLTVILFFYLKDGSRLLEGFLSVVPGTERRSRWRAAATEAWETLGHYFQGQLLVALVDATFIGIGLLALGIPLALPLAVLILFGALFPLIGALVTGALAVLVALAHSGVVTALLVLAVIVAVQQLEGNVLQPYILSRAVRLHPLIVLLSVTAGTLLLGVLGAFLAVPVTAVVVRLLAPTSPLRSEPAS